MAALASVVLVTAALAQQPVAADRPPPPLDALVMGLRTARIDTVALGELRLACTRDLAGHPHLLWSPDGPPPVPADAAGAQQWLAEHAAALGHGPFRAVAAGQARFEGADCHTFRLERDGVALKDGEVRVYRQGDRCVGLLNLVPPLPAAAPDVADVANPVYVVRRGDDRLVVAERRTLDRDGRRVEQLWHDGEMLTEVVQAVAVVAPAAARFDEYTFPGMNFPDQIWADSKGRIWFSEPPLNRITMYDPDAASFRSFATDGTNPDGMTVDDQDRVWTGLYTSGNGLGMIDTATGTARRFPPPYANALMAIPTWTSTGTLLVTDHSANRISEFDPISNTWLRSMVVSPSAYPVEGDLEPETGTSWFAMYTSHEVGRVDSVGYSAFATPTRAGPAFPACHDGKVYFSYWVADRLGEYDVRGNRFVEHQLQPAENGGPIAMAPNGHVIVGTRGVGYIVDFDPVAGTYTSHAIPTVSAGLKDGLTVAPDGTIWFTLTGRNKIARLVLP